MKGKILIIDDDVDFREAMTVLLEAKGYEVLTASGGEEGLSKAASQKPGLVLLDVMMGSRAEGVEVARKMKSESSTSDIPVIITTGMRRDMNLAFTLEPDEETLPVAAVLEKPVRPEMLLKQVAEHLKS